MILPYINEIPTTRQWNDVFYGYNHNLRIGEGEFFDMKNMTGDDFPVLSPRGKRGVYAPEETTKTGLVAKDGLCYLEGTNFVINKNKKIDLLEDGFKEYKEIDNGDGTTTRIVEPKQLISMGSYVIIMPDKVYVNTQNETHGRIEASYESNDKGVTVKISRLNGDEEEVEESLTPPKVEEGKTPPLWLDISKLPHTLNQYSTSTGTWTTISTTYVKLESSGIGSNFETGDAVTISGFTGDYTSLNGTFSILSKGDGFIVITGLVDKLDTIYSNICVERKMPEMDYIVEANNRLWGCKYGLVGDQVVNEIYACRLGDFKNWYSYQGIASDSYAVTVGTDGHFTGAISYLGYPIFFKEGYMHKIYGNYPSNYQVQTTACRGVEEGSWQSLEIVNEVLYYKSRTGICAYAGSLPTEVSGALGDETYYNAVGGHLGNKYYVSMEDIHGESHLFVYDTKKGMWHKEDNTKVFAFCNCRGDLYFINYNNKQIQTVLGTGDAQEGTITWEAVTGYIGTDSPDKKYVSRLDVRMKLEPNAKVSFYADYDSLGEWELLYTMTGRDLKSFAAPVKPKRCDHFRLKICGVGNAKIYSICKTVEWGSDK